MLFPDYWFVPVTRVRTSPGGVNDWGEKEPGARTVVKLPQALFAPSQGAEQLAPGVDASSERPSVLWPDNPSVDVEAGDVLVVGGCTYEVVGQVEQWPAGLRAQLSRVVSAR